MWIYLLLFGMIGFFIWLAYNEHVKNKNARDMHRMLKEQKSISVSDTNREKSSLHNTYSAASELEKLAKMHKDGILSDAEFEAAKRKVIKG